MKKRSSGARNLADNSFFEADFLYKKDIFTITFGKKNFYQRNLIENFIQKKFFASYAAEVKVSYPILISVKNKNNEIIAALGIRDAGEETLFLENYLDKPLIEYFSTSLNRKVARNEIAEVGNLATNGNLGIRILIISCFNYLRESGFKYIALTGTKSLCDYFSALKLNTQIIADAAPFKIKNANLWGSYYQSNPKVLIGDISVANSRLDQCFGTFVAIAKDTKTLSFIPSGYGNATRVAPRFAGIPIPYVNGTYGKTFNIAA